MASQIDTPESTQWQNFILGFMEFVNATNSKDNATSRDDLMKGIAANYDFPEAWFHNKEFSKKAKEDAKQLLRAGPQSFCSNFIGKTEQWLTLSRTALESAASDSRVGDQDSTVVDSHETILIEKERRREEKRLQVEEIREKRLLKQKSDLCLQKEINVLKKELREGNKN